MPAGRRAEAWLQRDCPARNSNARLITTGQAKAILSSVRPRDLAGKTRRRLAVEQLAALVIVENKIKTLTEELKAMVLARGSRLMDLPERLGWKASGKNDEVDVAAHARPRVGVRPDDHHRWHIWWGLRPKRGVGDDFIDCMSPRTKPGTHWRSAYKRHPVLPLTRRHIPHAIHCWPRATKWRGMLRAVVAAIALQASC